MNAIKDSLSMVSIWTGTFASESALLRYLAPAPNPELSRGDLPSFSRDTGVLLPEGTVTESSVSADPVAALRQHSFSGSLPRTAFDDLAARLGANALFLAYGINASDEFGATGLHTTAPRLSTKRQHSSEQQHSSEHQQSSAKQHSKAWAPQVGVLTYLGAYPFSPASTARTRSGPGPSGR